MNVFFLRFYWLSVAYIILLVRKVLSIISSIPTILPLLLVIVLTTYATILTWNASVKKKEQILLDRQGIHSYADLVIFSSSNGDEEFSTKLYRQIQPLLSDDELLNIKKSFYQEKTILSMKNFWESLYTINPTSADVLISLATISYQLKDMENMKEYKEQLKYVDPNNIYMNMLKDL